MRPRRAMTLVELMVALAIFSVIAVAVSTFIVTSAKVNYTLQAETDVATMSEAALDDIRWNLGQSRRLLDVGSGYLERLDLSHAPPPAGRVTLPRIEPSGSLSPRAGFKDAPFSAESVGNALLLAQQLPPYKDRATGRLVDLYKFVLYYLAKRDLGAERIGHMPFVIDLVRWESLTFADFQQVDSLKDPKVAQPIIGGLEKAGIREAWDAGAPPEGAFSRLQNGELVVPPERGYRVPEASLASAVPGLGGQETSAGRVIYSVAPNAGELEIHTVVPRFALPGDGFPLGLEVLMAGPSHGRKVLVRLVLAAQAQGRLYSRENLMVAAVWD